jgi:hypothetical protein
MSDAEYVAGAGVSCPFCGSGNVEVIGGLAGGAKRNCAVAGSPSSPSGLRRGRLAVSFPEDGGTSRRRREVECRDCGKTWRDVYHLAGYEGTDAAGNYREVEGKPQDPETGIYLVFVEGDIDPRIVGPFADGDERDKKARELRREHGRDHGIFMLDVEPMSRVPSIDAYCGGFFMEDEET